MRVPCVTAPCSTIFEVFGSLGSAPLTATSSETYFDVKNASLVSALTADELARFPPPTFHGCGGPYRTCHFSHACFSGHDGVLVPNLSRAVAPILARYNRDASVQTPMRARLLPDSQFRQLKRAFIARGHAFAVNCWRTGFSGTNPSHFIMGHGKLFVAATDRSVPRRLSTLLFHQCSKHGHVRDIGRRGGARLAEPWGWAIGVWKLIEAKGRQSNLWDPDGVNSIVLGGAHASRTLSRSRGPVVPSSPSRERGTTGLPTAHETVICAEDVYLEPRSVAQYLGANKPSIISAWRRHLARSVSGKIQDGSSPSSPSASSAVASAPFVVSPSTHGSMESRANTSAITANCSAALRVALWRRGASAFGSRRLINVQQISEIVSTYTTVPLLVLSASASTPFKAQIELFQSFDILISPHGSQLTNMLFARPSAIFIEVVAMHNDDAPCRNGRAFAKAWIMAYGRHLPMRGSSAVSLEAGRDHVHVNWHLANHMSAYHLANLTSKGFNPRQLYKGADLLVDEGVLRGALETAVGIHCGARKPEHVCGKDRSWRLAPVAPRTALCCSSSCDLCAARSRAELCSASCLVDHARSCPIGQAVAPAPGHSLCES